MSGWLLILALLVLGGVLATLGDRLGSRVGKARLSLFNLRPRHTAVVITVLTGSLISAVSLGLMLLVSQRLRTGLFELDQLEERLQQGRQQLADSRAQLQASQAEVARAQLGQQRVQRELAQAEQRATALRQELAPLQAERTRLQTERDRLSQEVTRRDGEIRRTEAELAQLGQRIEASAQELNELETNLIALRRGDVVLTSGQPLASAKVKLEQPAQAQEVITALLQQANLNAFRRVLPGEPPTRQILLVPSNDIAKLEELLGRPGGWVVSIRSAANVLRGEQQVLAFPDLRPNRRVVRSGEILASTTLEGELRNPEQIARRLNLLMAAAYARAQRQGTLTDGLQVDASLFNQLNRSLADRPSGQVVQLEAVAIDDADTPDPIAVELRVGGTSGEAPRPPRRPRPASDRPAWIPVVANVAWPWPMPAARPSSAQPSSAPTPAWPCCSAGTGRGSARWCWAMARAAGPGNASSSSLAWRWCGWMSGARPWLRASATGSWSPPRAGAAGSPPACACRHGTSTMWWPSCCWSGTWAGPCGAKTCQGGRASRSERAP